MPLHAQKTRGSRAVEQQVDDIEESMEFYLAHKWLFTLSCIGMLGMCLTCFWVWHHDISGAITGVLACACAILSVHCENRFERAEGLREHFRRMGF